MMEVARDRFVVRNIAALTLTISEFSYPSSNQVTIVAPQGCDVKWMNQLRQRRISCALERRGCGSEFLLVCILMSSDVFGNENARCTQ